MLIEKRSVAMGIVLTIVTCGIYAYYWLYQILDSLYKANNQNSTAGMDVLLCIITCGIYAIYILYKLGQLEKQAHATYGLPAKDDSILYVILGIFSYGIIAWAIIQNNINTNLADTVNEAYARYHGGGHGEQ